MIQYDNFFLDRPACTDCNFPVRLILLLISITFTFVHCRAQEADCLVADGFCNPAVTAYLYQVCPPDTGTFPTTATNGSFYARRISGTAANATVYASFNGGAFEAASTGADGSYSISVPRNAGRNVSVSLRAIDSLGLCTAQTTRTLQLTPYRDVNADGYEDFLTGAISYPGGGGNGRAYVLYGSETQRSGSNSIAAADVNITGSTEGLPGALSLIDDMNNDGVGDLVVGAFNFGTGRGRTIVYYGKSGGLSSGTTSTNPPDVSIAGENAGDNFAFVNTTGDFNGDGHRDLAVGARIYNGSQGRVYVFYGTASGLASLDLSAGDQADVVFTGEAGGNEYGAFVYSHDYNGDGFDDLVVGATNRDRAYIYYGSSTNWSSGDALAQANGALTGENPGDEFARFLGSGDWNSDGYGDLLIMAPSANSSAGRAYIYYGGTSGIAAGSTDSVTSADVIYDGNAASDFLIFGNNGDFNGDGFEDLALTASEVGTVVGETYVIYGSSTGFARTSGTVGNAASVTFTGQNNNDRFGVANVVDLNGDGYSDAILAAQGYLAGAQSGALYVFYGGATGLDGRSLAAPDAFFTGETAGDNLGAGITR